MYNIASGNRWELNVNLCAYAHYINRGRYIVKNGESFILVNYPQDIKTSFYLPMNKTKQFDKDDFKITVSLVFLTLI
jgi:hypothetical protein